MAGSKRAVIAEAQRLLKQGTPSLVVDGLWGAKTAAAFNRAETRIQSQVRAILATAALTPESISAYQARQEDTSKYDDPQRYISVDQANRLVAEAAQRIGMDQHIPALQDFLRREARRVRTPSGELKYDILSRNGSSRGLMQMQPGAWADATRVDPSLPGYTPFDPVANIRAGVAYAKLNARGIAKAGKPVNADTLYLAHNQGLGFFTRKIKTNVAGQSQEVQELIARYS